MATRIRDYFEIPNAFQSMNAFAWRRVLKNSENTKNLWADKRISHSEMLPFLKAN